MSAPIPDISNFLEKWAWIKENDEKKNNSAYPIFQLFINLSAVADGYDDDDALSFLNFVDDSIIWSSVGIKPG